MLHVVLKGVGIGVTALALAVGSVLWPNKAADPVRRVPEHASQHGVAYEPLKPGTVLTYRTDSGATFVREVTKPVHLQWWDGSIHEVVPVYDERMDGYFLFRSVSGEIQVVGAITDGRLDRWGEYEVVVPATAGGLIETVDTPAGRFEARVITYPGGTAWFAQGVGLIKGDGYSLINIHQVQPKQLDL